MKKYQFRVAVVTISDRCSVGEREDKTGARLKELLKEDGFSVGAVIIVPDDIDMIANTLMRLCDDENYDLVLTNGGTGVSPRDVTPEATRKVIEREIPGMAEAMRMESLKITPYAMISRSVAGIRGKTLIINLPGSPKGAEENYRVVQPALIHAMEKIQGEPSECAII